MTPPTRPGVLSLVLAASLLAGACGGGGDLSTQLDRTSTTEATSEPTTASSEEPTAATTEAPTVAPTVEPTATPTSPSPDAGWTTYTTADGLPGNDIVSVSTHADGTTWALVALKRGVLGAPASLALARYDDGAWTSVELPVGLAGSPRLRAGPPRLRAGPGGTAWLLGLEAFSECGANDVNFGPAGLWHYAGNGWSAELKGIPKVGDRLPYDSMVDADGTLWTVGISSIGEVDRDFDPPLFFGSYGLSSYDGQAWTDVPIPNHFFFGLDCQRLFIDDAGTVWLDWADATFPAGRGRHDISIHARLDGETWTRFENPFDLTIGDQSDELVALSQRAVGGDGTYVFLIIGDVRAFAPGVTEPGVGDVLPVGGIVFDGESWGDTFTGEFAVTEGHTITPFIARPGDFGLTGDVTVTTVIVHDTIYLTGLGGLIRIDTNGDATTLTTADGLASNATLHITATPEGTLWVATDAGVSRYLPDVN